MRSVNRSHGPRPQRRGIILLLSAFLIIAMMAVLALSIDTGYMYTMQTQLDRSVDAAALAGAGSLLNGTEAASDQIVEYLVRNPVGSNTQAISNDSAIAQLKIDFLSEHQDDLIIESGHWNPDTQQLDFAPTLPSAVRVQVAYPNLPLFFGRVLGRDKFSIQAESVATFQPRDIVLVLDLSGSMNDDSELKSINHLPQEDIEANLAQIWQELGSPTYGVMDFDPVEVTSAEYDAIKAQLGLDTDPYPFPNGSWNEYIDYVRGNANIANAGYANHYGMMTLINFWLDRKPSASDTPGMWEASAQPISAVKDAVGVFVSYVSAVDTSDRIGLSVYNSASGEGQLEFGLTNNFSQVVTVTGDRQAGHYHSYTNIAAGMTKAREELESHARTGAFKMMVVLTDGNANWTNGGYDEAGANNAVLQEASLAKAAKIPVLTISLGAGADTQLMQDVADSTEGLHFNVPGGQSVEEYKQDLKNAFREIAAHRPLKLVK